MVERLETFQLSDEDIVRERDITLFRLGVATFEAARLYRSQNNDEFRTVSLPVLATLKVAFPEKLSNKNLKYNQDLKLFYSMIWLGIEINDVVDIVPEVRRTEKQGAANEIFSSWKESIRKTRLVAGEKSSLVDSYQREILFLERNIHETGKDTNVDRVLKYRETMNAISLVHNSAALLDRDVLRSRTEPLNKREITIDALQNKYEWVIKGEYENETERKLAALFNTVMGIQVVDDWLDMRDDEKLGLSTIALEVVKKYGYSHAKVEIDKITLDYFSKAEELGITKEFNSVIKNFFTLMKRLSQMSPDKIGGRREKWLNGKDRML